MSHHVPARITSFRPSSLMGLGNGSNRVLCMRRWLRVCVLRDFNGYGGHGVWVYILCVWGALALMCGKACSDGGYLPKGMIPSRPSTSRRAALACEPRCALVVVVWLRPRPLMAPGDRVLAAHVVVWLRPRPLMAPGVRVLAALGRADVAPRACASLSLVGSPVSAVPPVGGLARALRRP